jgi:hypothetical protein
MNDRPNENTPRVLALALAFFGGLAALGFVNDVHDRLGPGLVLALAAFALAFAVLTWWLDPNVRALASRLLPARHGPRPQLRSPAAR